MSLHYIIYYVLMIIYYLDQYYLNGQIFYHDKFAKIIGIDKEINKKIALFGILQVFLYNLSI